MAELSKSHMHCIVSVLADPRKVYLQSALLQLSKETVQDEDGNPGQLQYVSHHSFSCTLKVTTCSRPDQPLHMRSHQMIIRLCKYLHISTAAMTGLQS